MLFCQPQLQWFSPSFLLSFQKFLSPPIPSGQFYYPCSALGFLLYCWTEETRKTKHQGFCRASLSTYKQYNHPCYSQLLAWNTVTSQNWTKRHGGFSTSTSSLFILHYSMTLLTTKYIKMVHKPFTGQYQAYTRKKHILCLVWPREAGLQPKLLAFNIPICNQNTFWK